MQRNPHARGSRLSRAPTSRYDCAVSRRLAGRATALALIACSASCADSVAPGDPLIGTWRSGEFDSVYPSPPSTARTVVEFTFDASGALQMVITRRYPVVAGDPYSGCTWVERHPSLTWRRFGDGGAQLVFVPPTDAQYTSERTGCTDSARNRSTASFDDGAFSSALVTFGYVVRGDALTLTAYGPVGMPPVERTYTRVRR